ncbi:MAG: nucleotidyltransferase family protein [Verrucomicrobiota bacterium]
MKNVTTAFVLGAGLGTRLRPLTLDCPKPLLKIGGRPIITYAFEHLQTVGIRHIIVNTHHCAEKYDEVFPDKQWNGIPLTFSHESPEILETGGGIRKIFHILEQNHVQDVLVYNGDIITNIPIQPIIDRHLASNKEVTMSLRNQDGPLHINCDKDGLITDIRHQLKAPSVMDCLFACIYCLKKEFIHRIPPNQKISIIPFFLELLKNVQEGKERKIDSIVLNDGYWSDIGTHEEFKMVSKRFT